jgi:cell division septum initiation protein DivIVA
MKRRQRNDGSLDQLVAQTSDMIGKLLREHRALQAQNERLTKEVQRLSQGWEDIRRLARVSPRRRRSPARRP